MSTLGASWETDGGAVQQERLNARTVWQKCFSVSLRSGMQRQTYKLIHTENTQTSQRTLVQTHTDTVWQLQHHTGYYRLKSLWSSADGAVLSREMQVKWVKSYNTWNTWTRDNLAPVCTFYFCAFLKWWLYWSHRYKPLFVKAKLKLSNQWSQTLRNPAGCLTTTRPVL